MAVTANHFMFAMLTMVSLDFTVSQIGVFYGRKGDNLPSPSEVVALYKKYNIQRMRIYDPYPPTLEALNANGSNIELTMKVPNGDVLEKVAASPDYAKTWVQNYVRNYPNVRFRHIIVGDKINPIEDSQYVQFVLPAMQHVYTALSAAGLANQIKVSISVTPVVLEKSYPPADGVFRSNVTSYLNPIIQFLMNTGAPLFVDLYPYFAYVNHPDQLPLEYALLQPNGGIIVPGGIYYHNLYYALVDAMYAALEKSIAGSKSTPEIKVSESGWPSDGGEPNITNVENARIYTSNLVQIVKYGTPKRPGQPIETYIRSMFDENLWEPGIEQNFGVFHPNGQPKYELIFNYGKMLCYFPLEKSRESKI